MMKNSVTKFAIRHRWGGSHGDSTVRYLNRDPGNSPQAILVGKNTYDTVDQAVETIVEFARRFPALYASDTLEIVGIRIQAEETILTAFTEIPLKTLY